MHNIPLTLHNGQSAVLSTSVSDMIARYDVAYPGLLINKDRSRYTPLNHYEMFTCSNRVTRYCSPENAILPVNLNRLCIMALFLKDDKNVDKYCRKIVLPNALLPMGTYLDQGLWVIGTKEKLDFAVVCLGPSGQKSDKIYHTETVTPPIGIVQLKTGCHAANNFLSLPPFYVFREYASISDPYEDLLKFYNTTTFCIWEPLSQALPNLTDLVLPGNLSTVKQIPMDDLILRLQGMQNIEIKDDSWPLWAYLFIDSIICILVGGGVFLYLRYRKQKKLLAFETPGLCGRLAIICGDRGKVDEDKPRDQMTTVSYYKETDEVNIRQGRTQSAPPEKRSMEDAILKHLYPSLPGTK